SARSPFLLPALLLLGGCAAGPAPEAAAPPAGVDAEWSGVPSPGAVAVLDATLWMQTAAEYEALSRQTWAQAARLLPEAIADTTWTAALEQGAGAGSLPPAIIVDV